MIVQPQAQTSIGFSNGQHNGAPQRLGTRHADHVAGLLRSLWIEALKAHMVQANLILMMYL